MNAKLEDEEANQDASEESEKPSDQVAAVAAVPSEEAAVKEPKVKTTKTKRKLITNQSLNQDVSQNHKLTEYFAVRRSVRKPKTAILEEKQKHLEDLVQSGVEDGLQVIGLITLLFKSEHC